VEGRSCYHLQFTLEHRNLYGYNAGRISPVREVVFEERILSRVIKIEDVGKERTRLTRAVVLSLRELMSQTAPDERSRDLTAFIVLALEAINATIDQTVTPWEKRGYWLKADRFRLDWEWTGRFAAELRQGLSDEDWAVIAGVAAQIVEKLKKVKVPQRHRLGTPWVGAWEKLKAET